MDALDVPPVAERHRVGHCPLIIDCPWLLPPSGDNVFHACRKDTEEIDVGFQSMFGQPTGLFTQAPCGTPRMEGYFWRASKNERLHSVWTFDQISNKMPQRVAVT
jgi:hypothetical protein